MIILHGVSKGYRERSGEINWVLRDFSGSFPDGVNAGILARSGQGKTTLIRLLSGVDIPTEGRIVRKSGVSFPFGFRGYISGRLTLRQNVRFACDLYGQDFSTVLDNVKAVTGLASDGIQLNRLSGEQRGLIATALFFSLGFSHMLFDELDGFGVPRLRSRIFQLMSDFEPHQSIIMTSDDPDLLRRHCALLGVLDRGRLTMYSDPAEAVEAFNAIVIGDNRLAS